MATPPDGPDLMEYLAAELKVAEADLPASWATLAELASSLAYAEVSELMASKGYLVSVILTWDKLNAYCLLQGLYRLTTMGVNLSDYSEKFAKLHDLCEKDGPLDRFGVVVVGGVAVAAGGSAVGGIRYGRTRVGCLSGRNWVRIGQGLPPLPGGSCNTGCGG